MYCVNKVKSYLKFHVNNLKLLKNEIRFKLYSYVNNIVNNIDYKLIQQNTCKLKMIKCNWSVVKSNNNCNVWSGKKQDFF